MDRFNRIVISRWTDGVNDRQRFNITYDENSNILGVEDPILDNYTGSGYAKTFSLGLTMDGRNRITEAKRGVMSGGSITGTARMDQIWALDQVGNWDNVKTDLNGDNDGTDAGELNDTRTYNTANELLTRSAPSSTQTHDAAGQMTFDGQDHNFKYDAFGRLVKVTRTAVPIGTSGIRAEYKYDGLGQRIGWHCDLNADDDVTTADPWMWFIYDDRWRIVNTYRLAYSGGNWNVDSSAKERFVHHAAGLDGKGGSSYIDAVILSDRDLTNGWSGAADGTIESRLYHLQNWRNDLCAVADGYVIARHYRYSAYGSRTEIDAGDYNRDGFTDFFDILDFNADRGASAARADFNNNGVVNSADSTDFVDSFNVTSDDSPHSAPRGLYAGYEHDPALEYQGALSGGGASISTIESHAHVRHRVYSTELGRWTRRDPLGYIDGLGLYEYCEAQAIVAFDPMGLAWVTERPAGPPRDSDPIGGPCCLLHVAFWEYEGHASYAACVATCIAEWSLGTWADRIGIGTAICGAKFTTLRFIPAIGIFVASYEYQLKLTCDSICRSRECVSLGTTVYRWITTRAEAIRYLRRLYQKSFPPRIITEQDIKDIMSRPIGKDCGTGVHPDDYRLCPSPNPNAPCEPLRNHPLF